MGVVDSGLDSGHEDLRGRVNRSLNHSFRGGTVLNSLTESSRGLRYSHGTTVATQIVANHNSVGIRGIAPGATVYGINLLAYYTDAHAIEAFMKHRAVTDVQNHSWGVWAWAQVAESSILYAGLDETLEAGPGGAGVIHVKAAGNGYWGSVLRHGRGTEQSPRHGHGLRDRRQGTEGVVLRAWIHALGLRSEFTRGHLRGRDLRGTPMAFRLATAWTAIRISAVRPQRLRRSRR